MRRARERQTREPTIALINIVFLMLVFFMVAGTLAKPLDSDLSLVRTAELEGRAPPDALVIHADGRLSYRNEAQASASAYVAALPEEERKTIRLVPDRDLPAETLVGIARELRGQGAERVLVVTERGLQ
ncbi:MAG: biopolymer transporter ExbD [Roseovarius sp.]